MGLGSNLGPGEEIFHRAFLQLAPFLDGARVGPLVRSPAMAADGTPLPHADYLNTAIAARTSLSPEELLAVAKRIEYLAGRRAGPRDAPRPLDIDLLLYDDLVTRRPELTLPHPRLARRRFALLPAAELLPRLPLPPRGPVLSEVLARLADAPEHRVLRVGWSRPPRIPAREAPA